MRRERGGLEKEMNEKEMGRKTREGNEIERRWKRNGRHWD